ncbi:uncharacterized protein LOC128551522 [Mercenaria mercenaria]|uniref:uncharacterized protein LOC128551522 n=1 Tax=Mercenaria mercenaria TaxID=6596 RepID=UPI00234F0A9B|nr:uncharacterized protein LOC128551522 [Mercenaria mercenaria]
MKGDEWIRTSHRAKLTTIDSDYDDQTTFDLQVSVTHNTGHASWGSISTQIIGDIHVDVTEINRHWNKRCYSHVDPHMKTVDGLHYEAQEEGDYMMAMNDIFQTEVWNRLIIYC